MMTFARRGFAVMALWAGLVGLLFGFEFWLYPESRVLTSPGQALLTSAEGLIAWCLGCRLAIAAPRLERLNLTDRSDVEAPHPVLDPPAVALRR